MRPVLWLTLFAGVLALQISPYWYPKPDSCLYISAAKNFAAGEGLQGLGTGSVMPPPAYPIMLSPAFLFGDRPILALAILQWVFMVFCLLGVYVWANRQLPQYALWITALTVFNLAVGIHYRRTLKEIATMAVLIWAVNILQSLVASTDRRNTVLCILGAIALVVWVTFIKYPAIMLLGGFGCALLVAMYRKQLTIARGFGIGLAVAIPSSCALLGLLAYERQHQSVAGGPTYTASFQDAVMDMDNRITEGIRLRVTEMGRITLPGMMKAYGGPGEWLNVNTIIHCLWFLVLVVGWWSLAQEKNDVLALTFPFYLALYITWPFDQGCRFLVPLAPILLASGWIGLQQLFKVRPYFLGLAFALHFAAATGYWLAIDLPRAQESHRLWPEIDRLAEIIEQEQQNLDEPAYAAMVNSDDGARMMLQLRLDQLVPPYDGIRKPGQAIKWIIVYKKTKTIDGYRPRSIVQNYQVFQRAREVLTIADANADADQQADSSAKMHATLNK